MVRKKPYRAVFGLWVSPDFSEVEAGRAAPPRTNHSAIDYAALLDFFERLFSYGPPVTFRIANDTIDQVTVHARAGTVPIKPKSGTGTLRCEDFGERLLEEAARQSGSPIDVRAAWQPLHQLPDRDFAPPPMLIPFVVEATDFEDSVLWTESARPSIGLSFRSTLDLAEGTAAQDHVGQLAPEHLARLAAVFGTPFTPQVALDRLAMDTPPAYLRDLED